MSVANCINRKKEIIHNHLMVKNIDKRREEGNRIQKTSSKNTLRRIFKFVTVEIDSIKFLLWNFRFS